MLLAGANRDLVSNALVVTNRAIRKWINCFNQCGVDGLIVKKRPGRMTIINDQQASELTNLIDQPQQAQRTFSTAKAFHGYISKEYQIQCSYETVVRFFHKQGYALKTQKRLKKLPVSERYYDKRSIWSNLDTVDQILCQICQFKHPINFDFVAFQNICDGSKGISIRQYNIQCANLNIKSN
jgi:transposase